MAAVELHRMAVSMTLEVVEFCHGHRLVVGRSRCHVEVVHRMVVRGCVAVVHRWILPVVMVVLEMELGVVLVVWRDGSVAVAVASGQSSVVM